MGSKSHSNLNRLKMRALRSELKTNKLKLDKIKISLKTVTSLSDDMGASLNSLDYNKFNEMYEKIIDNLPDDMKYEHQSDNKIMSKVYMIERELENAFSKFGDGNYLSLMECSGRCLNELTKIKNQCNDVYKLTYIEKPLKKAHYLFVGESFLGDNTYGLMRLCEIKEWLHTEQNKNDQNKWKERIEWLIGLKNHYPYNQKYNQKLLDECINICKDNKNSIANRDKLKERLIQLIDRTNFDLYKSIKNCINQLSLEKYSKDFNFSLSDLGDIENEFKKKYADTVANINNHLTSNNSICPYSFHFIKEINLVLKHILNGINGLNANKDKVLKSKIFKVKNSIINLYDTTNQILKKITHAEHSWIDNVNGILDKGIVAVDLFSINEVNLVGDFIQDASYFLDSYIKYYNDFKSTLMVPEKTKSNFSKRVNSLNEKLFERRQKIEEELEERAKDLDNKYPGASKELYSKIAELRNFKEKYMPVLEQVKNIRLNAEQALVSEGFTTEEINDRKIKFRKLIQDQLKHHPLVKALDSIKLISDENKRSTLRDKIYKQLEAESEQRLAHIKEIYKALTEPSDSAHRISVLERIRTSSKSDEESVNKSLTMQNDVDQKSAELLAQIENEISKK